MTIIDFADKHADFLSLDIPVMTTPAPNPRPWFAVTDGQNRPLVVDRHGWPVAYCLTMENASLIANAASIEWLKTADANAEQAP